MKKFMAVILSLALALSLCACGGGAAAPATGEESKTEEAAPAVDKSAPAAEEEEEEADEEEEAEEADEEGEEEEADEEDEDGEAEVIAIYKYDDIDYVGEDESELTEDDLATAMAFAALKEAGYDSYLVIFDDQTAVMMFAGMEDTLVYDEDYFYSVDDEGNISEEDPSPYAVEDNELVLVSSNGIALGFVELTEEEVADFAENGPGDAEEMQALLEAFFTALAQAAEDGSLDEMMEEYAGEEDAAA